jgi:Xaa-Pro aminopeptidase
MRLFQADVYTQRRINLAKSIGKGIILIQGNAESPMNYKDNVYHFRQNSNFLYYFGINQPDLNAVIDAESGVATLYGHQNTIDDIIWLGEVPSLSSLAESVGVSSVKPGNAIIDDINAASSANRALHYLPPYRPEHHGVLQSIKSSTEDVKPSIDLIKAVVAQREIKSAIEITEIEHAVNITKAMHIAAMKAVKPDLYEYEVVAKILDTCKAHNASLSYGVIFSINGQVLHNHYHHNKMTSGRLVINDSGAENDMCYAGDITRTIPVSGRFTDKQKDIYNIVYEMETTCIDTVKAGIKYRDVHLLSNRILLERFKELGLVKGNVEDMVNEGVAGMFMPHGLGHQMGLDVHDMEDLGENLVGYEEGQQRASYMGLKSLRLAKTLKSGFVLTVEPGIYFIPQLIQKYNAEGKFKDFVNYDKLNDYLDFGGIRIEDNILITDDGRKVLGDYIPKTIEEVEGVMKG